MSARLYWSPVVGDGLTPATAYRVEMLAPTVPEGDEPIPPPSKRAHIAANPRYTADGDLHPQAGRPRGTHAFVVAWSDHPRGWELVDADPAHLRLTPDLPVNRPRELLAFLAGRTAADIPPQYRAAWVTMLTALGIRSDDVAGSTPVRKLIRRVLIALDPQGANDEGTFG